MAVKPVEQETAVFRALLAESLIGRLCLRALSGPAGRVFEAIYARAVYRLFPTNQRLLLEGKASLDTGLSDAECPHAPGTARALWMLGRNIRQRELARLRGR